MEFENKRIIPSGRAVKSALRVYKETFSIVRKYNRIKREQGIDRETLNGLMTEWYKTLLNKFHIDMNVIGAPVSDERIIFVGNHVSYVDIPVFLANQPAYFVAKKEIAKWPVLGSAFKKAEIIFVKRESKSSRKNTVNAINKAIREQNKSICIFPSGTTDIAEKKPWRRGAFSIAKACDVKIQPFRLSYSPLRDVAYIDDDFLLTHMFRLAGVEKVKCTIEFGEPFKVENPEEDCKRIWEWTKQAIKH